MPYVLTSAFNEPRNYSKFPGGKVDDLHEGADFDVFGVSPDNKDPVLCCYDGTVVKVGFSAGYGNYAIMEHERNGSPFFTWYCHLDEIYINENTPLIQGNVIGEIGKTGNVTGEHLHLNLQVPNYGLSGYIVANVVNPMPYF